MPQPKKKSQRLCNRHLYSIQKVEHLYTKPFFQTKPSKSPVIKLQLSCCPLRTLFLTIRQNVPKENLQKHGNTSEGKGTHAGNLLGGGTGVLGH